MLHRLIAFWVECVLCNHHLLLFSASAALTENARRAIWAALAYASCASFISSAVRAEARICPQVVTRVDIPDELIPADAKVEIDAKVYAGARESTNARERRAHIRTCARTRASVHVCSAARSHAPWYPDAHSRTHALKRTHTHAR
eukprot:2878675-Pleurochrysis_carterae.AAC.1